MCSVGNKDPHYPYSGCISMHKRQDFFLLGTLILCFCHGTAIFSFAKLKANIAMKYFDQVSSLNMSQTHYLVYLFYYGMLGVIILDVF